MPTRRAILAGLLAASAASVPGWAAAGSPAYLACARDPDGAFALYGLGPDGAERFRVPLPERGHAGAAHPSRSEAVVFARRPGAYALVIDCASGAVRHRLAPPEGRQLNGHGAFLAGGAVLATVEQVSVGSEGRMGLWDAEGGYRRLGEIATGGIGPHEALAAPDGRTLVVANGGIETDPADRSKLNLDTMRPSLAYLTAEDGIEETVTLPPDLAQCSIRHLALRSDGLLAFAMQWEGEEGVAAPLLGLHRRGEAPRLLQAPEAEALAMRGYAGSVAFSGDGARVAVTSPHGGRVQSFAADGRFLGVALRADACGLAAHPEGFVASDGLGALVVVTESGLRPLSVSERAWDNHLVPLA